MKYLYTVILLCLFCGCSEPLYPIIVNTKVGAVDLTEAGTVSTCTFECPPSPIIHLVLVWADGKYDENEAKRIQLEYDGTPLNTQWPFSFTLSLSDSQGNVITTQKFYMDYNVMTLCNWFTPDTSFLFNDMDLVMNNLTAGEHYTVKVVTETPMPELKGISQYLALDWLTDDPSLAQNSQ